MSPAPLELILALKVFYDGSGKLHDPGCRFVNLGSLIGEETCWADLRRRWLEVLEKHSAPFSKTGRRYFHASEAFQHHDGYDGWNSDKTFRLVLELIRVLGETGRTDPLAISCSVSIADYRKVKSLIPSLRSPEAICLDICFGLAIRHPHRDVGIEVEFDRTEGFYPILRTAFKQNHRGRGIWWAAYVSKITEVRDMRESPEIQAADLLAYLANRYRTHGSGDPCGALFFRLFLEKKHYHTFIDETALLALFEPDGKMRNGVELPAPQIKAPFVRP